MGAQACIAWFAVVVSATRGLRGVAPGQTAVYSAQQWTCADSDGERVEISGEWVNDGFCDCADGTDEPGTNACTHGRFYCANKGHVSRLIPSSMVDDSFCDCCDGSDEPPGSCPDACAAQAATVSAEEVAREATLQVVRQKRVVLSRKAKEAMSEVTQQIDRLQVIGKKLTTQLQEAAGDGAASYRLRSQLQRLQGTYRSLLALRDGGLGDYLAVASDCVETNPAVSEKLFAGGSKNYVAKSYVFRVCPFRFVVQIDRDRQAWEVDNCVARAGEHARGDCEAEAAQNNRGAEPEPTLLGMWLSDAWGVGQGRSTRYMLFRDPGGACANGLQRSVNVSLLCGLGDKVVRVAENGMCNYEMSLETPLACDLSVLEDDDDDDDEDEEEEDEEQDEFPDEL